MNTEMPIRILQIGEGNFLRGFADWMIDIAIERNAFQGGIAIVKPRPGEDWKLIYKEQNCEFSVCLRGLTDGKPAESRRRITAVREVLDPREDWDRILGLARSEDLQFVISNTTESGICCDSSDTRDGKPPVSFPAKLTRILLERWTAFSGDPQKGLLVLPTELLDHNGDALSDCVLQTARRWDLPEAFCSWMRSACTFCNTLVDRIVTGHPEGASDPLEVTAEPFALWAIEDPSGTLPDLFPLADAGLPVIFPASIDPYAERKVRILNGAHTGFVPLALLKGHTIVNETMRDPFFEDFVTRMLSEEVIPTLSLPRAELEEYACSVLERFRNPFIEHALMDIARNSAVKWGTRCLPSLLAYHRMTGQIPQRLTVSLAALLAIYSGPHRALIHDDSEILSFFEANREQAPAYRTARFFDRFYGGVLNGVAGLTEAVSEELAKLESEERNENHRP